jgi:hypothetical protein
VGKKPVQVAPEWKKAQKPKKHLLKNRQAAAAEANLQVRSHRKKFLTGFPERCQKASGARFSFQLTLYQCSAI